MSIARLLAGMEDHDHDERSARATPPDVLCVTLREIAARYAQPCPFKAGDLVTPRSGSDNRGKGAPHVVLEVLDRPVPDFSCTDPGESTNNSYGARRDMRVVCETRPGSISAFWVESYQFEPYADPEATI